MCDVDNKPVKADEVKRQKTQWNSKRCTSFRMHPNHLKISGMEITKLLIVEDDAVLNEQLADLLVERGYDVDSRLDGEQGLTAASAKNYDLIILDVMMPKRDGFSMLNILRKTSLTPVIMLTAKGAEDERIKGFYQGADDYLTKPFNTTELLLRVDALLRRSRGNNEITDETELELDHVFLSKANEVARVDEQIIELTPIQFRLLWTLILHRGEVLSKAFLYQTVLHRAYGPHDRSLDMHLSRVRRKLTRAGGPGKRLQTVHGEGYCIS